MWETLSSLSIIPSTSSKRGGALISVVSSHFNILSELLGGEWLTLLCNCKGSRRKNEGEPLQKEGREARTAPEESGGYL